MKDKFKKILEETRKHFNDTETVTIKTSIAHIGFLKNAILKPFQEAVEQEKNKKKKPATKAYETISNFTEKELHEWLVGVAVRNFVNKYVQEQVGKKIKK